MVANTSTHVIEQSGDTLVERASSRSRRVLRIHGDFSSSWARLPQAGYRALGRELRVGSSQVLDCLRVPPTGFSRLDSGVMAIGLHNHTSNPRSSYSVMFGIRRIPSLFRISAVAGGTAELSGWSTTERLPLARPAKPERMTPSGACTCRLSLPVGAYNEEAFHYLLTVEHKRFERSHRPFVLVLIEHAVASPEPQQLDDAVSSKVFATLGRSLRETDVIGWYREGSVVGALLTHLGEGPLGDVTQLMSAKIARALRDGLTERVAERLAVKLYQPYEESWS
jgi:hypothetical protein